VIRQAKKYYEYVIETPENKVKIIGIPLTM